MGFGVTSSAPCLAGVFGVCSFLFVTIWVAPENRARELRTRDSTVLTQDSQGSQMARSRHAFNRDQIWCIIRHSPIFSLPPYDKRVTSKTMYSYMSEAEKDPPQASE